MIIGTAGHVDHGKSALVTALTGKAMDRLGEERRRGITIELNFAPLRLPSGRDAAVIDVPGHEDLVRTMAAGASGIDVALLVVAADEGIMPQTEEHLLVLEQLGISRGIAVVTKADLAEPSLAAMVRKDVELRLAASPIQWGGVLTASARSGQGVTDVLERLDAAAASLRPADAADLFRLPVDRAFTVQGVGTVLTGSIWSGKVFRGDELLVMPEGRRVRVRSIESFSEPLESAAARRRVALGVSGVDPDEARRGSMVVHPDSGWRASQRLDAVLELRRTLTERTRVVIVHGTAHVSGWLTPRRDLAGAARVALDAPLTVRGDDRFIVRMPSPLRTVGGGRVVDPEGGGRLPWPPGLVALDPAARLHGLVVRRQGGVRLGDLPILLGCRPEDAEPMVASQPSLRLVGGLVTTIERLESTRERIERAVDRFHRDFPARQGIPTETLRQQGQADPAIVHSALHTLEMEGRLIRDGAVMRRPAFRPALPGGEEALRQVLDIVSAAGLAPPRLGEIEERIAGADVRTLVHRAVADGSLVLVEPDRAWSAAALAQFEAVLERQGANGPITIAGLRAATRLSRQYLIPLLEWADGTGLTQRDGDHRLWRGRRTVSAGRPA